MYIVCCVYMYVCTYACMYVCMHVCMYVYVHAPAHTFSNPWRAEYSEGAGSGHEKRFPGVKCDCANV
jgi:hypothetical protein